MTRPHTKDGQLRCMLGYWEALGISISTLNSACAGMRGNSDVCRHRATAQLHPGKCSNMGLQQTVLLGLST